MLLFFLYSEFRPESFNTIPRKIEILFVCAICGPILWAFGILTIFLRTIFNHDLPNSKWGVGDRVVYHKPKHSDRPSPRAKQIHPARYGESYQYVIDKYWIVINVDEELQKLVVKTRRGKKHVLDMSDKHMRKAYIWEWHKFP